MASGSSGPRSAGSSLVALLLLGLSGNVVSLSVLLLDEVLGSLEGGLESVLEGNVGLVPLGSGLLLVLGLLGLEGGGSLLLPVSLNLGELLGSLLGEGVELGHGRLVGEGVLLSLVVHSDTLSNFSQLGLDLVRVDDSGNVGAVHDGSVELVSLLLGRLSLVGAEHVGQSLESVLGEDEEPAEVASGGELEDVESVDIAGVDSGEVSSSILHTLGLVSVDDEGSLSHDVSGVSVLAGSRSNLLGLSDLLEVIANSEGLEGGEHGLGVLLAEVVDDEGELGHVFHSVTSGHDEGHAGGGGEGRSDGVSSLVDVDLSVPLSPDLEGGEHSGLSAHVSEGGLSRPRGS
mmetsp:Transcript_10038/g.16897  ORF Transcript_10038/g.16897 Transcript_10038/m.16897 type:complete len:345 (-) Transcript_10038:283-1317(-)